MLDLLLLWSNRSFSFVCPQFFTPLPFRRVVILKLPILLFPVIFFIIKLQPEGASINYERKKSKMLSKDAKTVLYALYKEYLSRRKQGISKSKAKNFDSAQHIYSTFFSDWSLEDIEDTLRELGRNKFLNNYYADQTIYHCELSDLAIVTMENQKKETLLSVADFISKFIP
ncbi:MAG: hypothetical protein ACLTEF_13890 [[Clostridium] leptum]|nr:MAG TPA: hypothetical protein [Caudoviricetes sp.]